MPESRPSLARKHTRKTEENRTDALDSGMTITLDGETYEVRIGDITPSLARAVRREFGCGPQSLIRQLAADPDIDLLAGFIWLARRIRGEGVDLEDVEAGVSYASLTADDFSAGVAQPEEVGDLPPED